MFLTHMFPVDSIFALAILWSQICFFTLQTNVSSVSTPMQNLPPVLTLQKAHYINSFFLTRVFKSHY